MTPERWRIIEELYRAARERGPEVLAGVDPELRGEVERLLAQDSGGKSSSETLTESTLLRVGIGSQVESPHSPRPGHAHRIRCGHACAGLDRGWQDRRRRRTVALQPVEIPARAEKFELRLRRKARIGT